MNKIIKNPKHVKMLETVYNNIGKMNSYDKNVLKNAVLETDNGDLVGMQIINQILREIIEGKGFKTYNQTFLIYHKYNSVLEKTGLKEFYN